MTRRWAAYTAPQEGGRRHLQAAFICDFCTRASIGASPVRSGEKLDYPDSATDQRKDEDWSWLPRSGIAPDFPDVPETIAHAAKEAHETSSINAHMAAILMARTVVEASAKHHGVTKGDLYKKIDNLKDLNLIRPGIAEAAHEIRHLGNEMAHGDLEDNPNGDDAADVLQLMDQLLNELFQGPALVAKMRARRNAK